MLTKNLTILRFQRLCTADLNTLSLDTPSAAFVYSPVARRSIPDQRLQPSCTGSTQHHLVSQNSEKEAYMCSLDWVLVLGASPAPYG